MGNAKGSWGIGFKKGLDNLTRLSFRAVSSGRDDRDFQVFSKPGRETSGITLWWEVGQYGEGGCPR